MKKSLLVFLFEIVSFIFFLLLISANLEINSPNYSGYITQGSSSGNITADNYYGASTSFYQQAIGYLNDVVFSGIHGFSFGIFSSTGYAPSLSIIKPANATYLTRLNLPLNFTSSNANSIWYNLDGGSNTTITSNITFNTTSGSHILYLFANNTYGNSSANVSFTVDLTKFIVYYNNYAGTTKGESTDFNQSTHENLQNLSGIILENVNYGKISFNTTINVTNDSDISDNKINLDSFINISTNFIEINTTALPNFNKSSTLYLYNLNFTHPRVLKNGENCSASICTEVNYSGGTFIFNVTQFTNYSAEETPSEIPVTQAPSGGGVTTTKFEVTPGEIHIKLKQGETKHSAITIKNTGTSTLELMLAENKLTNILKISNSSLSLSPGKSETIALDFLAREDTLPGLNMGKIIVKAGGVEKEILVAVEIESKTSLFDIEIKIPPKYTQVSPGEDLFLDVKIYNLGSIGRVDANIEYLVKDKENNIITSARDTFAVETQTSFTKIINIPENTPLGRYIIYASVTYNEKVGSSSLFFDVIEPGVSQREKIYIVVIIILVVALSFIIYYFAIRKKEKGTIKRGEKIQLRSIMKR